MDKLKAFVKRYFTSFAYFYRYLKSKIFIAFFLSVAVSLMDGLGLTMFIPLLQAIAEDGEVTAEGMGKMGILIEGLEGMGISLTVMNILIVMIIFFSLKGLSVYGAEVYRIYLQESFIRKIRLNLLKGLNRISFKRFVVSDVGRIQNTMTGEVDRVSRSFRYYFQTFERATMVIVYMSFAFAVDPKFALLVAAGGLLTNFLYKALYKHTKGASRRLTGHHSEFQGQVIQHVGHFKYLNATGTIHKYAAKLENTVYKIEKARRKIGKLASIAKASREPLLVVVIAVVIIIQVQVFGGAMAGIIMSLLFFFRALQSLTDLQSKWNSFLEYSGSLENMLDFEDELKKHKLNNGKEELTNFHRNIQLKNVDFSYGSKKVLHAINLSIDKNQSMAFVGESGSGKTTLVNLISGLLPEDAGQICVDDQLMRQLNKQTYQQRIGYVSQDPVVFNDTIYNNITFWDEPTSENLKRFEKAVAQASLIDFLKEQPQGKETPLGNNGINLSGGQKQRVSIARELYKNIDILILDEATSALDSETENAIQESIDALQGEYTLLIVAHRLATIRNVDEVVLMDQGVILDRAPFKELIKRQERFRKMVELQEL